MRPGPPTEPGRQSALRRGLPNIACLIAGAGSLWKSRAVARGAGGRSRRQEQTTDVSIPPASCLLHLPFVQCRTERPGGKINLLLEFSRPVRYSFIRHGCCPPPF